MRNIKYFQIIGVFICLFTFHLFPQTVRYVKSNTPPENNSTNALTDQFTEQTPIALTGVYLSSVAWGDYDNDGHLDILLTGTNSSWVPDSKIYKNNGDGAFTEQTSISLTAVEAGSVGWGDYDNDGDLDILLTGSNSNYEPVSKIYKNNGDGTFTEQTSISLTGVGSSSVAWGDYDSDGDLDILLTGRNSSNVGVSKIYNNNGNGTFTEQNSVSLTGVSEGSSVEWGDYDNDGDLDILLSGNNSNGSSVSQIYKNNGDGSFTWQTSISLTGVANGSVAWGDYDNDGDLDILLTGYYGGNGISKIYKNNGDGTFSEQTSISLVGVYDGSVAWGDYDNDGDLDILLTGGNSSVPVTKIYKNNGDGTFTDQASISLTGVYLSSVAWGDYDNDGDLDILLTGNLGYPSYASVSKIYKNNNAVLNSVPNAPTNLTSTVNGNSVTFNWDKSTDDKTPQNGLHYNVVIGTTANSVNTLSPMSDRTTGFRKVVGLGNSQTNSWTIKDLPEGTYYWSVQASDGAYAGSQFASEQTFSNNVEQFTEQTSISLTGVYGGSVAWGDYDNDGDLDILLTGRYSGFYPVSQIYKNNGNGTFTEQTSISLINVFISSVAWGDYDNDSDLDILLTGWNSSNVPISKIYKNNGNETFTNQTSISLTSVFNGSVAWGDYDNDGDIDILLTGYNSDYTRMSKIYKNNGDGTFTEQTSISLTGVAEGSAAWGDYDNDGDLDILLTGSYVSKIFKNNGDGSFTEETTISLTGVYRGSAAWGDYDNDGDLDILLTGSSGDVPVSKIYQNNGDGSFTEETSISLTGVYRGSVAWGDYDNDGDLDVLLTGLNGGSRYCKIYQNNGDGTFTEQTSISLTGVDQSSVAWGDYDNDGDLDILLSGSSSSGIVSKIYKNNNAILNTVPNPPANLTSTVNGNSVTFNWNKSTDDKTPQNGLQYNVVIGTMANSVNTLSPMSDRTTGFRRVVRLGNSQTNSWTIKDLPDGIYYWSVQAIDVAFAGSQFASEQAVAVNVPLPVELTTFIGKVSGSQIVLNWETKTEIDNYGFEIERSKDGDNWTKIGFLEGAGTSNSPKYYSFNDKSRLSSIVRYRLKQLDNTGTFAYSDVVTVDVGIPKVFNLAQNFPNPFNPTTTINFDLSEPVHTTLSIFNIAGEKVKTLVDAPMEAGRYGIVFDASALMSGIYFYRLQTGKFVSTKKLILLK